MVHVVLWIRDVYAGSRIPKFINPRSRIPDPGSQTPNLGSDPASRIQQQQQKRSGKRVSCLTSFCSHKFNKTVKYIYFEQVQKKI